MSLPEELSRVLKSIDFPENQYVKEKHGKSQIVLHHTASGGNALGDINYWKKTRERVATCVVIDRDGTIYQCFASEYWAAHLGTALPGNRIAKNYLMNGMNYDRHSIGVELDSWGYLKKGDDGLYRSYTGAVVPEDDVQVYHDKFRGQMYYEKYTMEQIHSLMHLLLFWGDKYKIPLDYRDSMFEINGGALDNVPGIYTHCSYRTDKSDIHPQPEMIEMLKSLKH